MNEYLKNIEDEAASLTVATGKGNKKTVATDTKKRKQPKNSQGTEKLKKVNTNGMAKLSSFFKKES